MYNIHTRTPNVPFLQVVPPKDAITSNENGGEQGAIARTAAAAAVLGQQLPQGHSGVAAPQPARAPASAAASQQFTNVGPWASSKASVAAPQTSFVKRPAPEGALTGGLAKVCAGNVSFIDLISPNFVVYCTSYAEEWWRRHEASGGSSRFFIFCPCRSPFGNCTT